MSKQRTLAQRQFKEGNFRDAYDIFAKLCVSENHPADQTADDISMAVQCLQNLGRENEVDALLEATAKAHAKHWPVLHRIGNIYIQSLNHYGFRVAGEFKRGQSREGGFLQNSAERDRVRGLQLYTQATPLAVASDQKQRVAQFFLDFAQGLLNQRGVQEAWRLQSLTNLAELPDYDDGWPQYREYLGAPVDAAGSPLFYPEPRRWEDAENDGQRWRWLLSQAAENDARRSTEVRWLFANFLEQLYGVQSLRYGNFGHFFHEAADGPTGDDDTKRDETGVYALHTLRDEETIAKLATGIKRFTLPDEFNFLKIYRSLADDQRAGGYQETALHQLAELYANRRQYPQAAKAWRESIQRFGLGANRFKQERLDQIVGNWGQFETSQTQPAGSGAKLDFRFRNATKVKLEAQEVKIETLLTDIKNYLRTEPEQPDWNRFSLENLGYRLVTQGEKKYLGATVASWSLDLEPRPDHFDRRITIATPLQTAGAYLVTASLENGNVSKIVVWVADTALVHKRLDQRQLYFAADAVSGEALPNVNLEFFGFEHRHLGNNRWKVATAHFAETTDAQGLSYPDPRDLKDAFQWLVIARGPGNRLAFLGFDRYWAGTRYDPEYDAVKVFTMTDRPVYRPAQKVGFKLWVRRTRYDQPDTSDFAKMSFPVEIFNPQGERVYSETLTADEYGGLVGDYELPAGAPLGVYRIALEKHDNNLQISGGNQFRVEEYKKPEFEVQVTAPSEPVQLGEKITATIKAKYYFGSPVANGKVKYKITRVNHTQSWFPSRPWDWCYEPGYWWFAYDYSWYPGWRHWAGCLRPMPSWWHAPHDPPELVAEVELPLGSDGTLSVDIDTAVAKELHANQDHKYTITAEVTDESRRVIVGTGNVLVARHPFQVYTWLHRGYYQVGDDIRASFKAQTLDHQGVEGKGEVRLYRISYKDGEPIEALEQTWPLNTNDQGDAELTFKAATSGQYRLSYIVTDTKEHTREGAYIFTIIGEGFDGRDFRFNDIELVPNKAEYAPGEKVRLQLNVNRANATVLLFPRPTNGVYERPQVLKLTGKSSLQELEVTKRDMPNFFVEAVTIADGKVHVATKEIVVPPETRVLNVEVLPNSAIYQPGEKAQVKVRVTDSSGENFVGTTVLTMYDKAVEYISGGSNVPDIKSFFWKWRRNHQPQTSHSLVNWSTNLSLPNKPVMNFLGVFGGEVPDDAAGLGGAGGGGGERPRAMAATRGMKGMLRKGAMADAMPAAPMAAAPAMFAEAGEAKQSLQDEGVSGDDANANLEPALRTKFADTAFWAATLNTNPNGIAEVDLTMPENLTGWKVRVWGLGHGTRVGSGEAEVVTRKNILLRLQSPRFFVQGDEVTLSANVHNYLDVAKDVTAVLEVPADKLQIIDPPSLVVNIGPGGEKRIDWRCRVLKEGEAFVRMKALTNTESDAMEIKLPSYVHGMLKMEAWAGTIRPDRDEAKLAFVVPQQRRPEQSVLEVRYSPTLAGAMVDALPYLAEYPYGCTEQTLNRFLPSVITQKTLLEMKLNLAAIRDKRTNLNAQEIGNDKERAAQWQRFDRNPVFDEEELQRMVKEGVKALTEMQCRDGGWGWFSGAGEHAWPHTTAVVVHGLLLAKANDVPIVPSVIDDGVNWLRRYQAEELAKIKRAEKRENPWKPTADDLDALIYSVLVDAGHDQEEMREFLYRDRLSLSVYSNAMFGLALQAKGRAEQLQMILTNIDQFLVQDEENETAYLKMPNTSPWWYWYGDEIEANAAYLKLLARTDPKGTRALRLVKYLLNNRKHGTYWKSTRDTAYCVEAMADYLRASEELSPDMTVEVWLDGRKLKEVAVNSDNLFTFDNKVVLSGLEVTDGSHELTIKRRGKGPVYFNTYLTNFTLEDHILPAGLEVKVERKMYRLHEVDKKTQVQGTRGQVVEQRVEKYERIPLDNLALLKSGDLVEVELVIESKNDYEYVLFEDMKPAGFEPVDVRSGYLGGSLGAYVEFRDNRVAFFARSLTRGKHSISYRTRAEIPGRFSALPAKAAAMYAPELKANSEEIKLNVKD